MKPVAILVSRNISPFLLSIPQIIFDRLAPESARRKIVLCAPEPGRIPVEGGLFADVQADLSVLDEAELVIAPYWPHENEVPSPAVTAALQRAHEKKIEIAGLCLGAFLLGYAGLLDNRRATTHWVSADAFEALFPKCRLERDALYVDDDGIVTSAGAAAGIECCLHLLRKRAGAAVANQVARMMVSPPFREGGQSQYIEEPVPRSTSDARINALIVWLSAHMDEPVTVEAMAVRAAMSVRTLHRAFVRAVGMTPGQWLITARLKQSQTLLETTRASIESVAEACGFDSAITFRQRFKERFGVSPSDWRCTFRSPEHQTQAGTE